MLLLLLLLLLPEVLVDADHVADGDMSPLCESRAESGPM